MVNIYLDCEISMAENSFPKLFSPPEVSRRRKKMIIADFPVSRHFIFYINMKLMWPRPCIPTAFTTQYFFPHNLMLLSAVVIDDLIQKIKVKHILEEKLDLSFEPQLEKAYCVRVRPRSFARGLFQTDLIQTDLAFQIFHGGNSTFINSFDNTKIFDLIQATFKSVSVISVFCPFICIFLCTEWYTLM